VLAAREIDVIALTTPPRQWAGLAAGHAAAIASLTARASLAAGVLLLLGDAVRAVGTRSLSRDLLGVAIWCGAVGVAMSLEAGLFDALVLRDVSDVQEVARLGSLRFLTSGLAAAAALCAAPAIWIRSRWSARAAAVVVALACVAERWSVRHALTLGPDPGIAVVASVVPHHVPVEVRRVPWGCVVWKPDTLWEGLPLVREGLPRGATGCPRPVAFGSFPRGQKPLFAVPAATPVERLAGWTEESHGDVGIVVRLEAEPPRWRAEWRLSEVNVGVRFPPVEGDPRTWPLRGAVLLDRAGGEGDLGALLGPAPRVELLVLPEAAPTVADLLAVCDAAVRAHPRGLQCTLAAGSVEVWKAWARSSDRSRSPHAP
jgi:hypothetical protein